METIDKHAALGEKLSKGLELTYTRLLAQKKGAGTKLVIVRDGKIVHLTPEEAENSKSEQ